MSLVNNEELKNLTNTTNGSINKQVVDFAKNILFSQLKSYISDEKQYKIINDKISNMKIELLSSPNFKDKVMAKVFYQLLLYMEVLFILEMI